MKDIGEVPSGDVYLVLSAVVAADSVCKLTSITHNAQGMFVIKTRVMRNFGCLSYFQRPLLSLSPPLSLALPPSPSLSLSLNKLRLCPRYLITAVLASCPTCCSLILDPLEHLFPLNLLEALFCHKLRHLLLIFPTSLFG